MEEKKETKRSRALTTLSCYNLVDSVLIVENDIWKVAWVDAMLKSNIGHNNGHTGERILAINLFGCVLVFDKTTYPICNSIERVNREYMLLKEPWQLGSNSLYIQGAVLAIDRGLKMLECVLEVMVCLSLLKNHFESEFTFDGEYSETQYLQKLVVSCFFIEDNFKSILAVGNMLCKKFTLKWEFVLIPFWISKVCLDALKRDFTVGFYMGSYYLVDYIHVQSYFSIVTALWETLTENSNQRRHLNQSNTNNSICPTVAIVLLQDWSREEVQREFSVGVYQNHLKKSVSQRFDGVLLKTSLANLF